RFPIRGSMLSRPRALVPVGNLRSGILVMESAQNWNCQRATDSAQYLSKQEHGIEKIRDMIVDDIHQAQQRQDKPHILTLLHVLHHFLKSHPEACPPQHPWSHLY